jgi:hypothetical protein
VPMGHPLRPGSLRLAPPRSSLFQSTGVETSLIAENVKDSSVVKKILTPHEQFDDEIDQWLREPAINSNEIIANGVDEVSTAIEVGDVSPSKPAPANEQLSTFPFTADASLQSPLPSSKLFPQILAEARSCNADLSNAMDSRVWGRIRTGLLPTQWSVQQGWALRTGAAACLSMGYAITCALHPAANRWAAAFVFAPVIAIAVVQVYGRKIKTNRNTN